MPRGNSYEVNDNGTPLVQGAGLELALVVLDGHLRALVALHAPDRIFVHAGVVTHGGRTIVIPGKSFTGKTTLSAGSPARSRFRSAPSS